MAGDTRGQGGGESSGGGYSPVTLSQSVDRLAEGQQLDMMSNINI